MRYCRFHPESDNVLLQGGQNDAGGCDIKAEYGVVGAGGDRPCAAAAERGLADDCSAVPPPPLFAYSPAPSVPKASPYTPMPLAALLRPVTPYPPPPFSPYTPLLPESWV